MNKPRMTLREVVDAMRSYGMPISDFILTEGIRKGIFPFGHCIEDTYIVMRKDFENWAADYLLPYLEVDREKTDD